MYREGASLREIAKKYKISHNRVWQILSERDVPMRHRGGKSVTYYKRLMERARG